MAYLELSHLQKDFGGTVAVQEFQLEVGQGEFISLLGPSGCGKTTVLRMVAGFEKPTSGQIVVQGNNVTSLPPNRRKMGMVFQNYALFPHMTAAGNVGYGLTVAGRPKVEVNKRVKEMLELVQLAKFSDRYPYQLSGGQQQRVALARALAIQPALLLLDEPLSALDAKVRAEVRDEIRRIQTQLAITTIFVTHDQEEAMSISDRVVVMSHGQMEQVGAPFEIYNFPASEFVASFVGHLNLIPVRLLDASKKEVSFNGQTIQVGRMTENLSPDNPRLAVRPEEIASGRVDGNNNLQGIVKGINYLGSIVRIRIHSNGVDFSMDMFNEHNMKMPKAGDLFALNFPVEACWLI